MGIVFCEFLETTWKKTDSKGLGLVICIVYTFLLGWSGNIFPKAMVVYSVYFFFGFYMNLFLKWNGKNFSTTVCTGNIRALGVNFVNTFEQNKSKLALAKNFALVACFPLGSSACAHLISILETHDHNAIWVVTAMLTVLFIQYYKSLQKHK